VTTTTSTDPGTTATPTETPTGGDGTTVPGEATTAPGEVTTAPPRRPQTATTTTTAAGSHWTPEPLHPPPTSNGIIPQPPPPARTDPYLPAGVPDNVYPPQTPAAELLWNGECGKLLRSIYNPTKAELPTTQSWTDIGPSLIYLYSAAAQACLANWGPALSQFAKIDLRQVCEVEDDGSLKQPFSQSFATVADCQALRFTVYRWTQNLLKAHLANPRFVPNFPHPPGR